jgi:DNA mismatch repair protein MutL
MTERVRVLPAEVIDQISAGEVVERPASVAKELMENALDAGGTEVAVRAAGGGISLIEVSDNGTGMEREDALEALKRHATSKIRGFQDLLTLRSLGFRGEALSSIASVSRMELVTRWREREEGVRILMESGKVRDVSICGSPPGTRVRVEELFFNVPARRKFLRSESTEARHVRDVLERIAMVHPQVAWRYEYEGRVILDCPRAGTFAERVRQLWGGDLFGHIHSLHREEHAAGLTGFLSHPNYHRASASTIWLYVNRRPVQDRGLLSALLSGYGALLERGRYPVGVVHIELNPREVDVNVHPAKREVRFRDPRAVQDAVRSAVRRLLRDQPWVPILDGKPEENAFPGEQDRVAGRVSEPLSTLAFPFASGETPRGLRPPVPTPGEEPSYRGFRFLGQVADVYLVFAGPGGMMVVDQHAAHERILFEELQLMLTAEVPKGQGLLWDEVMELSAPESEALEEWGETLEKLGWGVEPFGKDAWRVRRVPQWMDPTDASLALRELLESRVEGAASGDKPMERVLASLACRAAVKAGRTVKETEALALLERMHATPARGLCPHGRPTVLEISLAELRRRFGRG